MADLMCCPYCGSEEYFVRVRFIGNGVEYRRFDAPGNGTIEISEGREYQHAKTRYCVACLRRIPPDTPASKSGD